MIRYLYLIAFSLIFTFNAFSQTPDSPVKVTLLSENSSISPGKPIPLALEVKIDKDWHVYWKNPGDAGLPLSINWTLPEGYKADEIQWPFPDKFTVEDMVGYGYHNEVVLLTHVIPPKNAKTDEKITLKGTVSWLVCSSSTCQPGSAPIEITLKTSAQEPSINASARLAFEKAREKIPKTKIQVKTIHKEGIVQLQVPDLDTSKVTSIEFFPEDQNVIDTTVDPVVSVEPSDHANNYFVNLKGGEEIGVKTMNLKGVLVLHRGDNDELAFNIDSPIQNNDQAFLSLIDPPKSTRASIGNSSFNTSPKPLAFEGGLLLALAFAFMGGILLNLMPCVLPVISFKVMSFVKLAQESRALTIKHGLVFSLGVIISFWVLAGAMLILRTYGQAVGWGFQLQEPLFVVILASLLFIFALSLFGVFEWGLVVASWAGQTENDAARKKSGYIGSFLSGVMATAVATPCTGPFLGSAVGFAVTLPIFQALLIFTVLGLGMCFPYILLSIFPSFLRFIPKPGAWMETFKQLMAFMLLATVLWLLWVFSAQTNTLSLMCVLAGFLCFSFGAWIYGRGCTPAVKKSQRILSVIAVVIMVLAGIEMIIIPRSTWYEDTTIALANSPKSPNKWDGWEEFSPERVAELRKQGTPVLIDFTAKWCLVCQANHLVLSSSDVDKKLADAGVVKMKADWTKNNPVITAELSKFGRTSVPLYVLYGSDPAQEALILPQVLTPDAVIEHVNEAVNSEIALK